ncbi:MAG: hypothetical protein RIC93_00105, partial [Alphaproteobacteria bacterium]
RDAGFRGFVIVEKAKTGDPRASWRGKRCARLETHSKLDHKESEERMAQPFGIRRWPWIS